MEMYSMRTKNRGDKSPVHEPPVESQEPSWQKERKEIERMLQEMPEMYFKEPEDLLSIFTELEEENLFLIQSTQDVEAQLEELEKEYRETQEKK